jgi:hypothetical protein
LSYSRTNLLHSNYEQLGLKFLLYSAEILFNKGLSLLYLGRTEEGMADLEEARREKATEEHNVIDDAINDRGEGYTVFSIVRPFFFSFVRSYTNHPFSPLVSSIAHPRTN